MVFSCYCVNSIHCLNNRFLLSGLPETNVLESEIRKVRAETQVADKSGMRLWCLKKCATLVSYETGII